MVKTKANMPNSIVLSHEPHLVNTHNKGKDSTWHKQVSIWICRRKKKKKTTFETVAYWAFPAFTSVYSTVHWHQIPLCFQNPNAHFSWVILLNLSANHTSSVTTSFFFYFDYTTSTKIVFPIRCLIFLYVASFSSWSLF